MLPTSVKAGTVFGQDFEILQRLAQGGMGTVYVALQHSTGKQRALKVMHAQYEGDETARKRFIQEAKAGASIDSDHIVEMVGAGIDPETNTPWIAMELLKGDDLKEVLAQRKRLSQGEVLEIFRQTCHALGKAHKMGLVHRDLKPENIFLATPRREGIAFTAKILDFGIAKLVRQSGGSSGTQTQAIGSPRWMSPEQADRGNAPISPATDVWALGLIAFNLLTGVVFWKTAHSETPSVIAQMCEILMDPIAPASQRAAEYGVAELLPPGFDAWFAHCVNRDTSARYADADEALAALEPLFANAAPVVVARVSRTSTPARGISTRPAPVSMAPSGYTLDIPTAHEQHEPFALDETAAAPPTPMRAPTPAPVPRPAAPVEAPRTRKALPIALAVLGPVGIAVAVVLGLRQPADVPAAPDADAAATADVAAPEPPPAPDVLPEARPETVPDAAAQAPTPLTVPVPAAVPIAVDVPPAARVDAGGGRHVGRGPRAVAEVDAAAPEPTPAASESVAYTARVNSLLNARRSEFGHCYEEHSGAGGGGSVTITLHFSIRPDGTPTSVGVSGTPEIGACIGDIVRAMSFATPVAYAGPFFWQMRIQSSATEAPAAAPEAPAP